MRKIQFGKMRTLALTALVLFMVGCANDETAQDNTAKQLDTNGLTEFAVVDNSTKALSNTRTAGEYTGSGIKFYWTSNDRLWINNKAVTPSLKESHRLLNRLQRK